MRYQVITGEGPLELQEAVEKALADGWELHGGVSCAMLMYQWQNERNGYTESDWNYLYAQAVTQNPKGTSR